MTREGYHRLGAQQMETRDSLIIRLAGDGFQHKLIARKTGLTMSGLASRLQKLREEGKLPVAGGKV